MHMAEQTASDSGVDPVWVFGYGSLLWKTDFPYLDSVVGHVKGYARKFWQGSTYHRGVPEAPGRVVTLILSEEECTWGIAYKVHPKDVPEVMVTLRNREKGGYTIHEVVFYPKDERTAAFTVLVYIGTETSQNYLGPASTQAIAAQIVKSKGLSGRNADYVLELAETMRAIAPHVNDEHLYTLEAKVKDILKLSDNSSS